MGGADLVGGRQLPRRLRFEKFVCQNERIWTRRGGARRRRPPGSATENDFKVKLDALQKKLGISEGVIYYLDGHF